ncbi:hypothetical protein RHGRI_002438 [Rhododendron griersonianum]|uniref:Uncharacterized protein n=1 Tax=Rhododendron griersonianum TaxID=479676 RepID=A0AAV6LPL0_9ERIC|nr:hypothetical protein RHGRI_002438 [Rhododendron griersonianum]
MGEGVCHVVYMIRITLDVRLSILSTPCTYLHGHVGKCKSVAPESSSATAADVKMRLDREAETENISHYQPDLSSYMQVDATKLILENIVLFIVYLDAARVLSKATILKRNSKKTHGSDNPVSASATDAQIMKLGK